jgi:ElaB/YqjD/DUF883 family membrane-anchored ribosome-binding protein
LYGLTDADWVAPIGQPPTLRGCLWPGPFGNTIGLRPGKVVLAKIHGEPELMTDPTMDTVTTAKLREDLATVMRDAEALIRATAEQGGSAMNEARAKIRESLEGAKQRLKEAEKRFELEGAEALRATDDYVRRNPWQAVGVAAGIGLVIGLLLSHRRT